MAVNLLVNMGDMSRNIGGLTGIIDQGVRARSASSGKSSTVAPTVATTSSPSDFTVIVQTNFQLVAYVTSTLHIAMLSLFTDIHTRLPNMALGMVTRASVKEAYRMGIRAAQIIGFLKSHAHPRVADRAEGVVPENVTDQMLDRKSVV